MSDDKKCKYILEDGQKCGGWALKDKDYCFSHDPDSREKKLLAVRKGGLAKEIEILTPLEAVPVSTSKDVVVLLTKTINEVREGRLDPRIGSAIGYLAGQLIRALEVAEVESKVEQVRAVLMAREADKGRLRR